MCIVELQMDRYFKRLASESHFSSSSRSEISPSSLAETQQTEHQASWNPISYYNVNDHDEIRNAYIQRVSYQHHEKFYLQIKHGSTCRFKEEWYL